MAAFSSDYAPPRTPGHRWADAPISKDNLPTAALDHIRHLALETLPALLKRLKIGPHIIINMHNGAWHNSRTGAYGSDIIDLVSAAIGRGFAEAVGLLVTLFAKVQCKSVAAPAPIVEPVAQVVTTEVPPPAAPAEIIATVNPAGEVPTATTSPVPAKPLKPSNAYLHDWLWKLRSLVPSLARSIIRPKPAPSPDTPSPGEKE